MKQLYDPWCAKCGKLLVVNPATRVPDCEICPSCEYDLAEYVDQTEEEVEAEDAEDGEETATRLIATALLFLCAAGLVAAAVATVPATEARARR